MRDQVSNPIKKLRQLAGLSQSQMAEAVGEHQANISRYENGGRTINLDKFLDWCRLLKITDYNKIFRNE